VRGSAGWALRRASSPSSLAGQATGVGSVGSDQAPRHAPGRSIRYRARARGAHQFPGLSRRQYGGGGETGGRSQGRTLLQYLHGPISPPSEAARATAHSQTPTEPEPVERRLSILREPPATPASFDDFAFPKMSASDAESVPLERSPNRPRASPVPCPRFPVPRSLFSVPCSLFPVPCSPYANRSPSTLITIRLRRWPSHSP
jgi:hypothetical protein